MYWQQHSWNRLPANHPQAINCSASQGYVSYQIAGETTYETSFDAALGVFRRSGHHAPGTKGAKRAIPQPLQCPPPVGVGGQIPALNSAPTTLAPAPTDCHGTNAIGSKGCRRIGKAASHPKDVPRPGNWLHCPALTSKISKPRPMFHCRTSRNTPKKFPRPAIDPLDNWLHEHIPDTWISHHLSKAHSQKTLRTIKTMCRQAALLHTKNKTEMNLAWPHPWFPPNRRKHLPYA